MKNTDKYISHLNMIQKQTIIYQMILVTVAELFTLFT